MRKMLFIFIFVLFSTSVFAAGSGGGGGGSGGGGSETTLTFTPENNQISNDIKKGSSKTITLSNGRKYKVSINEVRYENADLFFEGKAGTIKIPLNDQKEIDLDGDMIADLKVFYNSKSGRTGNFAFRELRGNERINLRLSKVLPTQAESGKGLKCGHLDSLRERVDCRLKLEETESYGENKLLYFPEECRALIENKQDECIDKYRKTQRCWKFSFGKERVDCVKENLGMKTIREEKENCKILSGGTRKQCISNYKEKAFDVIKFRFYDLEEKAEELEEEGKISKKDLVDLVSNLEEKKVEFNKVDDIPAKRGVVLDVRNIWKNFVKRVER